MWGCVRPVGEGKTVPAPDSRRRPSSRTASARGEKTKTVSVAVLDDAVDEGEETFSFRLSHATGARLGDATATGTIANVDPLQKMWLSRFGRTVVFVATEKCG